MARKKAGNQGGKFVRSQTKQFQNSEIVFASDGKRYVTVTVNKGDHFEGKRDDGQTVQLYLPGKLRKIHISCPSVVLCLPETCTRNGKIHHEIMHIYRPEQIDTLRRSGEYTMYVDDEYNNGGDDGVVFEDVDDEAYSVAPQKPPTSIENDGSDEDIDFDDI